MILQRSLNDRLDKWEVYLFRIGFLVSTNGPAAWPQTAGGMNNNTTQPNEAIWSRHVLPIPNLIPQFWAIVPINANKSVSRSGYFFSASCLRKTSTARDRFAGSSIPKSNVTSWPVNFFRAVKAASRTTLRESFRQSIRNQSLMPIP